MYTVARLDTDLAHRAAHLRIQDADIRRSYRPYGLVHLRHRSQADRLEFYARDNICGLSASRFIRAAGEKEAHNNQK